jgi:EPS-associated MarR family transcriptional regulator
MNTLKHQSSIHEDLGLLSVLDELEKHQQITQRELAKNTGLNLKKVNYCLHKFLEKGYIKFQRAKHNPDKRAYLYILTPDGIRAKSQLTYDFLKYTLDNYNQLEAKLDFCLGQMSRMGVKRLVFFGASDAARIFFNTITQNGIDVLGVIDSDLHNNMFYDIPVLDISRIHDVKWDGMLITSVEDVQQAEDNLLMMGIPLEDIWKLS